MSKYQNCAIFVDGNGRYCCQPKVMRVNSCAWCIINANGGDIPILVFPTGNVNDEPIDSGLVAAEGLTVLDKTGVFKLDIDCDALDGTDAPAEGAITVCCEENLAQTFDSKMLQKLCDIADGQTGSTEANSDILIGIQACLDQMKLLVAANNDATILAEISTQILAACDKMIANGESLQKICDKLEQGFVDMLECLKALKEKPDGVRTACFKQEKVAEVGFQVSDFDPADSQIGDTVECNFNFTLPAGATVEVSLPSQYTVTNSGTEYKATWAWGGENNPEQPINATVTLDGCSGLVINTDLKLCSGAGDAAEVTLVGVQELKELCYSGAASIFQGADGEPVDVSELEPCADIATQKLCKIADGVGDLNSLIESMKNQKTGGIPGADYQSAFRYINGRPPASSAWALIDGLDPANPVTVASGPNLNAFTADLESKGYSEWSNIEQHYICPCPEGGDVAGRYYIEIDGVVSTKLECIPLSEAPGAPAKALIESFCALRVEECNSAAILKATLEGSTASQAILEKMCEPCPLEFTAIAVATPIDNPRTLVATAVKDHTLLQGSTQTTFDTYGNETGVATLTAVKFDKERDLSTIELTPVAPSTVATLGAVKSISTVLPRKVAVAEKG